MTEHGGLRKRWYVVRSELKRQRYAGSTTTPLATPCTYQLCKQLHSERAESLVAKFKQGGGTSYIDEAIVLDRDALELCPPGHPKRSVSLIHLAVHLCARYSLLGAVEDLEETIVVERESLSLRTQEHPAQSVYLAIHLSSWNEQLGAREDIDEARVGGWGTSMSPLSSTGKPSTFSHKNTSTLFDLAF